MKYSIYDFVRCPEHDCDESNVGIDYFHDGNRIFFSFHCSNCGTGSMEDDFRWYVKCPNCNPNPESGVDHIDGVINSDGTVEFECSNCGADVSDHVLTRWNSSDEAPVFEPNSY